ncbi:hypothetical protein [Rhodococcus tibetensis]|uniref:Lipoprotein n=1 Tax=Rhodococcus tibetensis TaxID=2965064 RepID=A0ABT1QE01_9NOCA|nr:hypothetical protein [Rhodococcus sp. FXJ9.536]MCQ4120519.1 hypothetical protein [Rhodococcus sp. FXJ9.536]
MGRTGRRALAPAHTFALVAGMVASLAACDSQSGIPVDAAEAEVAAAPGSIVDDSITRPSTSARPAPRVIVGEVPGNPAAADAVRAWALDLVTDPERVTSACWTLPPAQIAEQYADTAAVLRAVAQPGVDGQFSVSWTGGSTTVSVKRSEIASGYACPHVHAAGTVDFYTQADAEHAVTRFLSREAGRPVNRADTETAYPLICPGFSPWDPSGTGDGGQPPLKQNPDVLADTTTFAADEMTTTPVRGDYVIVTVPVTDVSGVTKTKQVTLSIGQDGYCLGEVT